MKKGLLTVLLASLVLVGCQNYDDQFDDLNAQISALKSQVDGLSSLSGQVSSLSGTISGLQAGVSAAQAAATAAGASADAATAAANASTAAVNGIAATDLSGLEASLATLADDVAAVQASLATAASESAVTALQTELDAIEADLADLLATSNIYSTDVTVNSATTLNSALALGNKLNVLNATLTITGYAGMDYTKVQTLADRVNTMTGNLVYSAYSSTGTEITFNNLVSAGNITMTQPKGYSFPKLANAAAIRLNSDYETTVTNISFPVLTTATSIDTDAAVAAAFDINFTYATNVDFGAMVTAPGNTITITTKKDATLDMDAYKSTDASGNDVNIDLTLNGPASFTNGTAAGTFASTGLPGNTVGAADGTITLTNVATAAIHNFRGDIVLNGGVKNFTGNNIVMIGTASGGDDLTSATDLETLNVTLMRDNDPGLSSTAVANFEKETNEAQDIILGSTHTKLTSLTVTGTGGDVTASAVPALTTVDLTGLTAMDVTMSGNVALTSFTDATAANDWTFNDNDLMTSVNSSHTTKLYGTDKAAALSVVGNADITTLTIGSNNVDDLDITGNAKLATLSASSLTSNGASTAGAVDIYDNALVASLVKDSQESDAATALSTYAKGKSVDGGSITSASGLSGLDTYLAAAASESSATAIVQAWFDSVTKLEVQSTYGGAYTDMTSSLPTSAPARTGATATDFTSTYSGYMNYFFQQDGRTATTRTVGSIGKQRLSYAFDIVRDATTQAETRTLGDTAEGFTVYQNDIAIATFDEGDAYTGAAVGGLVETLDDLMGYINADTTLANGYNLDLEAQEDGFIKAMYSVTYLSSSGATATAGSVSTSGLLNFTFGNYNDGASMDLQAHVTATNGSNGLATGIIAAINAAGEYTAAATGGNGNQFYVQKHVSASGLDTSPLVTSSSFPTLSLKPTTTSTTAVLVSTGRGSVSWGSDTTSNFDNATANASNVKGSATSEYSVSTSKSTIDGLRLTLTNNTGVAQAAIGVGVTGQSNTAIVTSQAIGTSIAQGLIAAGTNIASYSANTGTVDNNEATANYVAAFSDISSGTSATVASAVTTYTNDKTGW
jgi:phage shock protein A